MSSDDKLSKISQVFRKNIFGKFAKQYCSDFRMPCKSFPLIISVNHSIADIVEDTTEYPDKQFNVSIRGYIGIMKNGSQVYHIAGSVSFAMCCG